MSVQMAVLVRAHGVTLEREGRSYKGGIEIFPGGRGRTNHTVPHTLLMIGV